MCAHGMRARDALLLTAMLLMLRTSEASRKPLVKIGVVSSPAQAHNLAAAVEAALIAGGLRPDVRLASVEPDEPLDMPSQVCAKAAEGVSAIVAYGEAEDIKLAAAAAARTGVPLLLVSPTPKDMNLSHWEAIHMYPRNDIFIQACAALCYEKGWQSAVLLHEGAVGASLVQGAADAGVEIAILARKLPPPTDEEALRNLLLVLKKAEHTQFIVWCAEDCIERVLAAAQRVGLLSERHGYILLALDLHTLDLEPYSHGGSNITGVQLFDTEKEQPMLSNWRSTYLRRLRAAVDTAEDGSESSLDFEAAEREADAVVAAPLTALVLTFDVVQTASKILDRLADVSQSDFDATSCDDLHSYAYADTLINDLRSKDSVDWEGNAGTRRAGRFRVVELARGGALLPVGIWDARYGVLWARPPVEVPPPPPGDMTNQTFVVLIMLNKPYAMIKSASERLTGNDRYEGFCIELFEKLSQILHFNYTLLEIPGNDNDLMLNLINTTKTMHFAITDLTITAERERTVDFTTPFMNLGISILYRKPTAPEPKLFAFMLPFSTGVWVCLGLAYVGTSLVLYVVGRLCPEEWQNPYPCIEEPEALENQFTLANALWFTLGAILCQGSEIAPVAYGSRAAASAWWIFALVITSSYTANLATLLAKKSNNEDFTNVGELANNTLGIKYGAKMNGSTYRFLKDSQEGLFKQMFEAMQQWEMPSNNKEAIKRVNNAENEYEPFAFLMESTSIEYEVERNCNLTQVGGLLDSKGYGIAMAKDSMYRQALNLALLNLQEAGELRVMKHRWWKEMNGGGGCDAEEQPENEELTMKNFLGLFLVLFIGCALGIFISLADLMLAAWRRPRDPTASYFRRLGDELRFVFHFQLSEKPVHGSLIPTPPPKTESIHSERLEEEEERIDSRLRSASFQSSGLRSRRRSSIHNASVRLARHARQKDRSTPTRVRVHEPETNPENA